MRADRGVTAVLTSDAEPPLRVSMRPVRRLTAARVRERTLSPPGQGEGLKADQMITVDSVESGDDVRGAEGGEVGGGEADFFEDGVGVLAERRGEAA
jgi:hypothetical protein